MKRQEPEDSKTIIISRSLSSSFTPGKTPNVAITSVSNNNSELAPSD